MPLRAISGDASIHAFELDAAEWSDLKSTYRRLGLVMPCCDSTAVPKTSSRGNYFFAHAYKGECATAPESAEHLHCKQLIAQAAKSVGWQVTTERPGTCPAGQAWVADVFCERGTARVAFEVQMSPQTHYETVRRQRRYKESGVRGAWFHAPRKASNPLTTDRDTPAFALEPFELGSTPKVAGFPLSLPEFVVALLTKRLTWVVPQEPYLMTVDFVEDTCWACRGAVKQVYGVYESSELDFSHAPMTVAGLSKALEGVLEEFNPDELRAEGLNPVGRQDYIQGKKTNWPFCNLCIHCAAPQNNFFVTERLRDALRTSQIPQRPQAAPPAAKPVLGNVTFPRVMFAEGKARWELAPAP